MGLVLLMDEKGSLYRWRDGFKHCIVKEGLSEEEEHKLKSEFEGEHSRKNSECKDLQLSASLAYSGGR